jgi:hypothetical protein
MTLRQKIEMLLSIAIYNAEYVLTLELLKLWMIHTVVGPNTKTCTKIMLVLLDHILTSV